MSDRRVVLWWQKGNVGVNDARLRVLGTEKGQTNQDGFAEFTIDAALTHYDLDVIEPAESFHFTGLSVGPDMTMTINRRTLAPPPPSHDPVVRLRRDGLVFRRSDTNAIWKWHGLTGFMALELLCDGELKRVRDYFHFARSKGVNVIRVFGMWGVTGFDPRDYPSYANRLEDLARIAAEYGLYIHLTLFCDQVEGSSVLMSSRERAQHVRICMDVMRSQPNLFGEVENEGWKNGRVADDFAASDFSGVLFTRTAPPDGEDPRVYGSLLDWTTDHTPRDDEFERKFKNLLETARLGGAGAPCLMPAVAGEPRRIAEGTAPKQWADYAAGCDLFGAGMNIHGSRPSNGDSGLQDCIVPGPGLALDCIDAIAAVWKDHAIPDTAASEGDYTRAGLDDAPCADEDALRSYAMRQGSKLTMVRVREIAPAKMLNGYRVLERRGPQQQIYLCER